MTGTGDLALFLSLLGTAAVLYGMGAMLGLYLRPVYAEDDAGSGRLLPR